MEHLIISSSRCPDSFVQLPNELGLILPAGDAGEINSDSIYAESQTHSKIYEDHMSLAVSSYKCQRVRTQAVSLHFLCSFDFGLWL